MSLLLAVTIPGIPPTPNRTRTRNFHANSAAANRWKDATVEAIDAAIDGLPGGWPDPLASATVEIVVLSRTARRRDPDNAVAACKPILDALVIGGILADDSFGVIRHLGCRTERAAADGIRVEVTP